MAYRTAGGSGRHVPSHSTRLSRSIPFDAAASRSRDSTQSAGHSPRTLQHRHHDCHAG